ncbi:MAG: hypothetical protein JW982_10575 [Spirochaetes bacterium]|nr:hypothetical protein [Spirochaetota bacterium]
MITGRIKSGKPAAKSPFAAFLMSLFFTGLGQIYTGDFSRGFALYLLNIIIFLYMVFAAVFGIYDKFFYPALIALCCFLTVKIFAIIDSVFSSRKNKNLKFSPSVRKFIYLAYAVFSSIFYAGVLFVFFNYFRIVTAADNLMEPSLLRGDICLISLNPVERLKPGEIIYNEENFSRIIVNKPSVFEIKLGRVWINGLVAEIDVPEAAPGNELSSLLYIEKYENTRFPVMIDFSNSRSQSFYKKIICRNNEIITLNDNRIQLLPGKVSESAVFRLEGVIFSEADKNMFKTVFTSDE